jgi:hypothetical protein
MVEWPLALRREAYGSRPTCSSNVVAAALNQVEHVLTHHN